MIILIAYIATCIEQYRSLLSLDISIVGMR